MKPPTVDVPYKEGHWPHPLTVGVAGCPPCARRKVSTGPSHCAPTTEATDTATNTRQPHHIHTSRTYIYHKTVINFSTPVPHFTTQGYDSTKICPHLTKQSNNFTKVYLHLTKIILPKDIFNLPNKLLSKDVHTLKNWTYDSYKQSSRISNHINLAAHAAPGDQAILRL